MGLRKHLDEKHILLEEATKYLAILNTNLDMSKTELRKKIEETNDLKKTMNDLNLEFSNKSKEISRLKNEIIVLKQENGILKVDNKKKDHESIGYFCNAQNICPG